MGKRAEKVLAVIPPFYRLLGSHNNRLLLSLSSLAEVLAVHDIDVKVLNLDAEPHENYASWPEIYEASAQFDESLLSHRVWDEYAGYLEAFQPDVVIVGAGDLILPTVDFGVPQSVRRVGEVTKRVLGADVTSYAYGVFPTLDPASFLHEFDGVVVSEAEMPMVYIRLLRQETGLILGEFTPNERLDEIPFIRHEKLVVPVDPVNMDYIVSARGCPHSCHYCVTPVVCSRKVRTMNVKRFVDEVEFRMTKYGLKAMYFADMNLLQAPHRAMNIFRVLMERNLKLKWWCEARADSVTAELVASAKLAGCSHLKIGVEGDETVMQALGKKETEVIARKAVEMTKAAGLGVVVYTMLGAPGLTDDDFKRSYAFLKGLDATHYVVNMTVPHMGTPLFARVKAFQIDGWQHLDVRLRDFWGLKEETVQAFMELNRKGKKEDSEIRSYGKRESDN
jgi:hypothetical protein